MNLFTTIAGILLLYSAHALSGPWDVDTVKELDVHKFIGRWYEAYGSWISHHTFEKDSCCICSNYGLRDDGKISVLNARRIHSPTGKASSITGYAYAPDPKVPGKLKVAFPHAPVGDYWIIKLGPLGKDGLYSYAVVTSKGKKFLWILVRDVDDYMKNHDAEIQKYVKEQGFTSFLNKPRKTYQGKDCLYPPKN